MDSKIKTYLHDILKSIEEIESYFDEEKKDFNEFVEDFKTKRAVERNLEIIGEAVGRILKIDEGVKIKNARRIVDTRNRIIHGYDKVSDDIIWSIVVRYVPRLKDEVEGLLND